MYTLVKKKLKSLWNSPFESVGENTECPFYAISMLQFSATLQLKCLFCVNLITKWHPGTAEVLLVKKTATLDWNIMFQAGSSDLPNFVWNVLCFSVSQLQSIPCQQMFWCVYWGGCVAVKQTNQPILLVL